MNVATLTWFVIGACLVYVVAQDSSIYDWLVLQSKSFEVWLRREWFKIRHNPDSPWVRWEIDRNAEKMADEFLKQYNQEKENE